MAIRFIRELKGIFQQYEIPYEKGKTSLQISKEDFEAFDYIIGMDASMFLTYVRCVQQTVKIRFYSFASESVPDPWYTGDFEETYQRVQEGCQAWLERLEKESEDGKS